MKPFKRKGDTLREEIRPREEEIRGKTQKVLERTEDGQVHKSHDAFGP